MGVYDQIAYINVPNAQSHPSRLFVMGRLAGLNPRAVETSRVLEIGASEGANLIGLAIVLPSAEFVGIELAETPVARGHKTIADLGLGNVRLLRMNVLDVDQGLGEFDYIIAHGVYAWTPMAVRDKILAVTRAHLSAQGVAFVSYNTHPAGHIRKMVREMMLYRIGGEKDPVRQLELGRELLRVIAMGRPKADALEAAVAARAEELIEWTDSALFHDDLADSYEPVYFHEFVAHAGRHNLQYMSEANLVDSEPRNLSPEAVARIREMAAGDRIAEEQYFDFARSRRFRQTLLCHAEHTLSRGTAAGCYATSSAREVEEGVFVSDSKMRMTTNHPALVAYARLLTSLWPASMPVAPDEAELSRELFRADLIDLHGFPGIARRAGERPRASRLARYQAARGDAYVTTLWHRPIKLEDEEGRKLVGLMDGKRDRAELAQEMGCSSEMLDSALLVLQRDGILLE